jgi:hypothetical protein
MKFMKSDSFVLVGPLPQGLPFGRDAKSPFTLACPPSPSPFPTFPFSKLRSLALGRRLLRLMVVLLVLLVLLVVVEIMLLIMCSQIDIMKEKQLLSCFVMSNHAGHCHQAPKYSHT